MSKMPLPADCRAITLEMIRRCFIYIFRIINACYFFEGFYLTFVSAWYLGFSYIYKYLDTTHPMTINCLTVILGCLLLIMSMISFPLSFMSASPKWFGVYAASISFLFSLQIVIIVFSIFSKSKIITSSEKLQVRFRESFGNNSTDIEFRSIVEHKLQCCGLDGPHIYDVAPESCCKIVRDEKASGKFKPIIHYTYSECLSMDLINYNGCTKKLIWHLDELINPTQNLICIVGSIFKVFIFPCASILLLLQLTKVKPPTFSLDIIIYFIFCSLYIPKAAILILMLSVKAECFALYTLI